MVTVRTCQCAHVKSRAFTVFVCMHVHSHPHLHRVAHVPQQVGLSWSFPFLMQQPGCSQSEAPPRSCTLFFFLELFLAAFLFSHLHHKGKHPTRATGGLISTCVISFAFCGLPPLKDNRLPACSHLSVLILTLMTSSHISPLRLLCALLRLPHALLFFRLLSSSWFSYLAAAIPVEAGNGRSFTVMRDTKESAVL